MKQPFGPLGWLLNLFSNIWFGIALLVLLFVYCSIGSAMPAVRQLPALEMTEFEWFHWRPFNVLIALFTLTMVVITVRRIPLRKVNAGVWMIHSGIVILVLGSYYYFGTKVEGDTPVFRRQVTARVPDGAEAAAFPAIPGSGGQVQTPAGTWSFQIQSTNNEWEIVSDAHKGKKAYAVNVMVTPPDGEAFVRQLLADYPQFTEDVIPGKGRAIKNIGRKLVRDELELSLDLYPQEYFHVMDTWALYIRRLGEKEWIERPIEGLPRYHDRIASREKVWFDPHDPVKLRPIDLEVPPADPRDPLAQASLRVTSYLRYAHMDQRWRDGGDRLNPVVKLSLFTPQAAPQSFELVAFDPRRSELENGMVAFRWLGHSDRLAKLPMNSQALLHVEVPEAEVDFDLALTPEVIVGGEGPFQSIPGTDIKYRVVHIADDLPMHDGRLPVSVAMVEVQTESSNFTRMVADDPKSTRDMRNDGDPHGHGEMTQDIDPRIKMTYQPRSAPVILVAHPGGLYCVFNDEQQGRMFEGEVRVGTPIELAPGFNLRVDSFLSSAVPEQRPFVVPRNRRERDADETFAMIELEVNTGQSFDTQWLHFNRYALPSAVYSYGGRFAYRPVLFQLPDGAWAEVLFSQQRMKLPAPVALQDFELDTHVGGYTGSALTIRNYISQLRFLDGSKWTEPTAIAVNQPTENGGFWYFQSMWDRPPAGNQTAGMNYTGLGVGNRQGVYAQLFGCCLAVFGMIFAFYVKPVLVRQRADQARSKIGQRRDDGPDSGTQPSSMSLSDVQTVESKLRREEANVESAGVA